LAKYFAFGDYGLTSEYELEDFDSLQSATQWFKRYTRQGDLGGYSIIEIASFTNDGRYIVHESIAKDEEYEG
jgi:hypothetical protein